MLYYVMRISRYLRLDFVWMTCCRLRLSWMQWVSGLSRVGAVQRLMHA